MIRTPIAAVKIKHANHYTIDPQREVETGMHSMNSIFQDDETHGLIQVDADNAFTRYKQGSFIKQQKFFAHKYQILCYCKPTRVFVTGDIEIKEKF